MLKRYVSSWWGLTIIGITAALVLLTAYSSLFGVYSDICYEGQSEQDANCTSSNLAFVILWDFFKVTNWFSPIITALATVAIGWFTFTLRQSSDKLATISGQQTKIANKQTDIAQAQLLAEHRPRLRVRHVSLVDNNHLLGIGDTVRGGLVVVNAGGTKARIVEAKYCFYFSAHQDGLPMKSPLDDPCDTLIEPGRIFEIGESCATSISGVVNLDHAPGTFIPIGRKEWTAYVMGQIRYQDEGGNDRFMGFCRQWIAEGTFSAVCDPDYEYED